MRFIRLHYSINVDSGHVKGSEAVTRRLRVTKDSVEFGVHSPSVVRDTDRMIENESTQRERQYENEYGTE